MTATQFFFKHAGWGYDPKKETRLQGRWRCARGLADAEQWALNNCVGFQWEIDQTSDSSEFSDEKPAWNLWACSARLNGDVVASLCGIDFGRDKEPWGNPYKRVVEAELAAEARP